MKKLIILILCLSPAITFSQHKLYAYRYSTPKSEPEPYAAKLFEVYVGDTVEATAYHLGYFRIVKNGKSGYVNEAFFKHNLSKDVLDSLSKVYDDEILKQEAERLKAAEKKEKEEKEQYDKARKEYLSELITAYGKAAVERALKNQVWVGMPKGLISFSQHDTYPKSKDKSTDSKGTIEIWRYPGLSIYIYNDKVYKIVESE